MEMLKDILELVVYVVLTGCGVAVVSKLITYANKKIDEVQANTKLADYAQLNSYIDDAQKVVEFVVKSVSQKYVDSLKESGSFDDKAKKEAKDKATETAKELMSEEVQNAVTTLRGDLDTYLDNAIENAVKNMK